MRSLTSLIRDINKYLRDEIEHSDTLKNLVEIKRLAVPRDRMREFLVIYDQCVRDEAENKYLRLNTYDLWDLLDEIYPEVAPVCSLCAVDFPSKLEAEIVFYKKRNEP